VARVDRDLIPTVGRFAGYEYQQRVLAEQHDEWAVARRYFSAESLTKIMSSEAHDPLPAAGQP
jgi:hypothetical protein